MTFDQFLNKWDRKKIDYDGIYGQQCVDVIKQYFVDCIGIPAIRNNAVDYWNNYPKAHFTRIVNTPSFVPKKGDIMVWGTSVGQYGHIAIVISANVNSFVSFDQNWPFDDGKGVAHFQPHNYKGVLGVLRPNKDVNFDQAAWDAALAAQKVREEEAALAKLEAEKKAKEEAERIAKEQEKLAEEQARLEKELLEKQEAEAYEILKAEAEAEARKEEEKNMGKVKAVLDFLRLSGWKTYIVVIFGVILNGLVATGYIDSSYLDTINIVLGFLGLGAVRLSIAKK